MLSMYGENRLIVLATRTSACRCGHTDKGKHVLTSKYDIIEYDDIVGNVGNVVFFMRVTARRVRLLKRHTANKENMPGKIFQQHGQRQSRAHEAILRAFPPLGYRIRV